MMKVSIDGLGRRFGLGLVERVRTRAGQLRTVVRRVGDSRRDDDELRVRNGWRAAGGERGVRTVRGSGK